MSYDYQWLENRLKQYENAKQQQKTIVADYLRNSVNVIVQTSDCESAKALAFSIMQKYSQLWSRIAI